MLLMVVDDLLEALAGSESAAHAAAVAHRGLSTLIEVLSRDDVDDTLASGAVDLVAALLRGASAETLAAVDATSLTMGALVTLVMKSDDRSMLQVSYPARCTRHPAEHCHAERRGLLDLARSESARADFAMVRRAVSSVPSSLIPCS